MQLLDLTFPTPEENLACDEALLDAAEERSGAETLRFWESSLYFIALGSSNITAKEVNLDACGRDGVPVLRRRSGGGAVLQGPGCLNYCLILAIDGQCTTIAETNSFVLGRNRSVLHRLMNEQVRHEGLTDLAIDGLKVSGNAQRRRMKYLMFHGTFLLDFDIRSIGRYLKLPSKQPGYRKDRPHLEFLRNTGLTRGALKDAMREEWKTTESMKNPSDLNIGELVSSRYGLSEWNMKL